MNHKSLYRKYRPNIFSEIVSQENTIKILMNSIMNDSFNHAYLFSGSKGTGKTSTAKVFAKAINCQKNIKGEACNQCDNCQIINKDEAIDIFEIDGASNNGVDEIRNIKENIKMPPMNFKYKIYIIDEVHMLTQSAFNALLKTLEEPPKHILFILATTEPYKVPATIISRCQWFEFKKISNSKIKDQFSKILKQEKMPFEIEAINELAILCDGSLRDGLNYLEKIYNYSNNITLKSVQEIFSILSTKQKILFLVAIFNCNIEQTMTEFSFFDEHIISYKKFIIDLMSIIQEVLVYRMVKKDSILKIISLEQVEIFAEITKVDLLLMLNSFSEILMIENVDDLKPILVSKILNLNNEFSDKYNLLLTQKTEIINDKSEPIKQEILIPKIKEEKNIVLNAKNKANNAIIDSAINVIVQADKSIRKEINKKWIKINDFIENNKFRNITKFYLNTLVSAATKNGFIIITENIIQANLINKMFLCQEHRNFLKFLLDKEYMIYALDKEQWKVTRQKYQELLSSKKLPLAIDIVIPKVIADNFDNIKQDATLTFMKSIFNDVEEI